MWQALDREDDGVNNSGGILSRGGTIMAMERKKDSGWDLKKKAGPRGSSSGFSASDEGVDSDGEPVVGKEVSDDSNFKGKIGSRR